MVKSRVLTTQEIGDRLRQLRGLKSLQRVANDTGIKLSTLCMYETGQRRPPDDVREMMADYYKIKLDSLFFTKNSHEK